MNSLITICWATKNRANSISASEQETQQISEDWGVGEESQQEEQEIGQQTENEENETPPEAVGPKQKRRAHGPAAGLGIGCIAASVMLWLTVFFTPQLPSGITYEVMLSTFIYPIIYLLALGLIASTVGIVEEHYAVKSRV